MDEAGVRRLAALVRLELSPGEDAEFAAALDEALAHLAPLRRADGGAPEDVVGAGVETLRADEPGADALLRRPEQLAPAWRDGYFLVPRVR